MRCVEIAHHGTRAHHTGAQGCALQAAPGNQGLHALGAGAAQRGDHIAADAQQQDRAAAQPVRQRAPENLRAAKGQQKAGQCQLGLRDMGAKALLQLRQGGQIEVGCQRLKTQQQPQRENHEDCRFRSTLRLLIKGLSGIWL
jgi:hypothetical protein